MTAYLVAVLRGAARTLGYPPEPTIHPTQRTWSTR